MSYNCSVEFNSLEAIDEVLFDLIEMMKVEGVRFDVNGDFLDYMKADCYDDSTGVISDWAKKHKLNFTLEFSGEDDNNDTKEFIDGIGEWESDGDA